MVVLSLMDNQKGPPKVFISYSWTSPAFQNQIRTWAERLAADGIEILLDQFDLREGQDKYVYMEKMVTDPQVTHVLMFSDRRYTEKANKREAGVGTESQIISKEIYDKVNQSKFVPVVCEIDDEGQPYLPVFASSRIWINFSSEDEVNKNWERLVRHVFGKPLLERPPVGKPPAYIAGDSSAPSSPAAGKFAIFKNAYLVGQKGVRTYRRDFLESCFSYIDELRPRDRAEIAQSEIPQRIVDGYRKLVPARNLIVDWVLLEASGEHEKDFEDTLLEFLERLLELAQRPESVSIWSEFWYEPHRLFVYEAFLYVVAALMRARAFKVLHTVLMGSYMLPPQSRGSEKFGTSDAFYAYTESINPALTTENARYRSQAMELMRRSADRADITFIGLMEADALAHLASFIDGRDEFVWYPQSHHYWGYGSSRPQFFIRATQRRHFANLATILGVASGDELRTRFAARKAKQAGQPINGSQSFENLINLEKLDTLA